MEPTSGIEDVFYPSSDIAYWMDELTLPNLSNTRRKEVQDAILRVIKEQRMAGICRYIDSSWDESLTPLLSESDIKAMEEENAAKLNNLEKAISIAKEDAGDVEVKAALLDKANHFATIGDWDNAVIAYEETYDKSVGAGGRLDILLTLLRIGLLYKRDDIVDKFMEKTKVECQKGGDWERRNRLQLYQGMLAVRTRRWDEAAKLLFDSIPVFTASEFISFKSFIFTAIIIGQLKLDRPSVKQKLIGSPEVNQILAEDSELYCYVHSLYNCDYRRFMESLIPIFKRIKIHFWLKPHVAYFARAIRVHAYKQFITPFNSVQIDSMALAFGLPPDFLEEDVADFVANGKLNCRINRVTGILVCTRRDELADERATTMQKGDILLNQLQKFIAPFKR